MSSILDLSDPSDLVYWCRFLFAFFPFARISTLVPTTQNDFADKTIVLKKDVKPGVDYLTVCMKWSETIQFSKRILESPLKAIPG